jgi:hypothetical protein
LSELEIGKINEFEILVYYNELYNRQANDINNAQCTFSREKNKEHHNVEMTYNQAVENAKNKHNYEKIVNTHNSVLFYEIFNQRIKTMHERAESAIMDEEETASAEKGSERKEPLIIKPLIIKHDELEHIFFKLEKQVKSYIASVKKVSSDDGHEVDIIDLSEFLLLTHIITAICAFNSYDIKDKKDVQDYLNKLNAVNNRLMREVLLGFNKLILKHRLKDYSDNEYLGNKFNLFLQRVIYNSMLYLYIIERNSKEQFILDELELFALNLFNNVYVPDANFEQYIIDALGSNDQIFYSRSSIIHLKNKYADLLNNWQRNGMYLKIAHSGFCKIVNSNQQMIKYKSIYGITSMPKGKIKHLINKANL